MAVSHNDRYTLSTDAVFQNRVMTSMIAASVSITTEAWTTPFHRERQTQAVQILNSPQTYKPLVASAVATDASVIGDATQGGTVALTAGNVATQAALVTDTHIDNAVSGQFNSFFRTPAQ